MSYKMIKWHTQPGIVFIFKRNHMMIISMVCREVKKQIQTSIKVDCPFKIKLKMIVRFPAYSVGCFVILQVCCNNAANYDCQYLPLKKFA